MNRARRINYLKNLGVVVIETSGTYVLGAEIETLKDALKLAKAHNCKKLLFDHRKATVIVNTMEGYERPVVYESVGVDRLTKVASLVNKVDDGLSFYETVCVNRGWSTRVFDNYDTALFWLIER